MYNIEMTDSSVTLLKDALPDVLMEIVWSNNGNYVGHVMTLSHNDPAKMVDLTTNAVADKSELVPDTCKVRILPKGSEVKLVA